MVNLFPNLEDMTQDDIIDTFKATVQNGQMWPMFKFLFDTNVSEDNLRVDYMRSILKVGYPITKGPTYGDSPDWDDYDEEGWE